MLVDVDVGCICLFVFKLYKGGNFVTIQVAFIIQTVLLMFMTASDSAFKKKKKKKNSHIWASPKWPNTPA
jgi:hypothetical protein